MSAASSGPGEVTYNEFLIYMKQNVEGIATHYKSDGPLVGQVDATNTSDGGKVTLMIKANGVFVIEGKAPGERALNRFTYTSKNDGTIDIAIETIEGASDKSPPAKK